MAPAVPVDPVLVWEVVPVAPQAVARCIPPAPPPVDLQVLADAPWERAPVSVLVLASVSAPAWVAPVLPLRLQVRLRARHVRARVAAAVRVTRRPKKDR